MDDNLSVEVLEIFCEMQERYAGAVRKEMQSANYKWVYVDLVRQYQRAKFADEIKKRDHERYAKKRQAILAARPAWVLAAKEKRRQARELKRESRRTQG